MPGNLLFSDKQFPQDEKDLKAILNYLYMLQEELRYTMGNLGAENFNEQELNNILSSSGNGSLAEIQAQADSQGANISLLSAYTGMAEVVEVETLPAVPDPTKTYKIGTTYYRWMGTDWEYDTSINSAYMTIAAINGQSDIQIKADKIQLIGDDVIIMSADGEDGGVTKLNGNRIITGTLYATSLAAVNGPDATDYIAMQNGFDFRNAAYMPYTDGDYNPYQRSIQGINALVFYGDGKLDTTGHGMTGNTLASAGVLKVSQGLVGASPNYNISQYGIELQSARGINLYAQVAESGSISLWSAYPNTAATNKHIYQLSISDGGIGVSEWVKQSNGSLSLDSSTTLWS